MTYLGLAGTYWIGVIDMRNNLNWATLLLSILVTGCSDPKSAAECESPQTIYSLYGSEINTKLQKIEELENGDLFDQAVQRAEIIVLEEIITTITRNPKCFDEEIVTKAESILEKLSKY